MVLGSGFALNSKTRGFIESFNIIIMMLGQPIRNIL